MVSCYQTSGLAFAAQNGHILLVLPLSGFPLSATLRNSCSHPYNPVGTRFPILEALPQRRQGTELQGQHA